MPSMIAGMAVTMPSMIVGSASTRDVSKVAVKDRDTKVIFEWNDEGQIIDMRFERIH